MEFPNVDDTYFKASSGLFFSTTDITTIRLKKNIKAVKIRYIKATFLINLACFSEKIDSESIDIRTFRIMINTTVKNTNGMMTLRLASIGRNIIRTLSLPKSAL